MAMRIVYKHPSKYQVFQLVLKIYNKIQYIKENPQNCDKIQELSRLANQWYELEFPESKEGL